jgi:DNA-binding HxlR family transcriptional regulator
MDAEGPLAPASRRAALRRAARLLAGVSAKVLATRLRELEERGLVARDVLPTSPPSVQYTLTPLGHEIQPVLCTIAEVGKKLQKKRERAPAASRR